MTKRARPMRLSRETPTTPLISAQASDQLERLRLESLLTDSVTGLRLNTLADLPSERSADLGVIYLQLGRFSGVESLYGWQLYDRLLHTAAETLRECARSSRLKNYFFSLQFTGSDGFYLLFDFSKRTNGVHTLHLEQESEHFREEVVRRIRSAFGPTIVDLMNVHATCLVVLDDPRVRPSRNLIRGLREAARVVESREWSRQIEFVTRGKQIISGRRLHAVYQPVLNVRDQSILGYEALIRGPVGSPHESPDVLFAAAREGDMQLELENLCLETIFANLPRAVRERKLFVNASPKLLTHPLFLDERNLAKIKKAHAEVIVEVSEKEVVHDYPAFRDVLDRLRRAGIAVAIDDAGSGYSGLESILQLRPEYIKVANSIVHDLHLDLIKREVITALASLGRQIHSSLVAEGIESAEELASIVELGVDYGQGFYLGRPTDRVTAPRASRGHA